MPSINMAKATKDDIYQFNRVKAKLAEIVGRPKLENNTMLRLMMDNVEPALDNGTFQVRTKFEINATEVGDES